MTEMQWPCSEVQFALGDQFVRLVGGNLANNNYIANIQTDSRCVSKGDLFVCLKGERFDAHEFVEQVVNQGALGVVAERPLDLEVPCWVVKNTRLALGRLAGYWRGQFNFPVIGVVGSNGKTTSKEMLASIARQYWGAQVCVTQGNLNNDIGVPLTLFRLRQSDRAAVIEIGMNHPGEINYLADLVKPDAVLLTNAQREHQEFMKSVEAVARENGSAFLYLPENGVAVVPALTAFQDIWEQQSRGRRLVTFGPGGEVCVESNGQGAYLQTDEGLVQFAPRFIGRHNMTNAAGVAAIAWALGVDWKNIVKGLEEFEPVKGRLKVLSQTARLTLIDDSYNANPDSVNAASELLSELSGDSVLVLGDMGEVGDMSEHYHREVGCRAKELGVSALYLLGKDTRYTADSFGEEAYHFETVEALVEQLLKRLDERKHNVLVKGSRFMKMERVIDALLNKQSASDQGDRHAA